jgi:hypothetical protein
VKFFFPLKKREKRRSSTSVDFILNLKEVVAMIGNTAADCRGTRQKGVNGASERLARLFIGLCLLFLVCGCTPALYNVEMRYQPTKVIRSAITDGRKYTLTVASFIDQRKMEDVLLVGRVIKSNGTPIPILPRYVKPAEAVSAALRELLFKSGYVVSSDRPLWEMKEDAIRPEWGTILIGGTIDELDVTCLDSMMMKRYSAQVRVTLVFADVQKKRIFYKVASESSTSVEYMRFSEGRLENLINGVLSDAIEKAIELPETGRQLREAIKP